MNKLHGVSDVRQITDVIRANGARGAAGLFLACLRERANELNTQGSYDYANTTRWRPLLRDS